VLALLPIDAETPRSLVLNPCLTDAEFEALSLASEWFSFERTLTSFGAAMRFDLRYSAPGGIRP
jgi:hypothetical protein